MNRQAAKLASLVRISAVLILAAVTSRVSAASLEIAWVSFHAGDDTPSGAAAGAGFTQAPDVEYTRLLTTAGHTVTRYVTTATPDVNLLNTFDLVIISRSVGSGNFQTPESTALWNSITAPTMILGGYILRGSRLGYTFGDVMVDASDTFRLTVNEPDHPIFSGVELDDSNTMVNPYAHRVTFNTLQLGISVNTDQPADGATILATVGTDTDATFGGMIIAEYPAGTTMANASADVAGGKRLVFLTGSREQGITSEAAGLFDLENDGVRLFLNAVSYLAGIDVVEPPPLISVVRPAIGATQYYAPLGISARANSGAAGGIPATNIFLVLNGTDVTSALTITGTPQERQIAYAGLVANTNYVGVLTVRDAAGSESVLNLNFDTLTPYTLPASSAHPVDSGVAAAPGMRARIVQAVETPVLANTADRAEAQLAGRLIDPATGEPHENYAAPSTDNPDGAYNESLINWSFAAGQGAEIGNFRDPQFPDEAFPGVVHNFNVAAEIVTYLELTPGRHMMGVNSDDGFVVYTGVNFRDAFAVSLGRFDGGRGAADTVFQFEVSEAGIYPFRLVFYQGDGDGNLEWFSVDPNTGEKTLINDRSKPAGIRAWRQVSSPERPYVVSLDPAPGQANVELNSNVSVTLQDAGLLVQEGTVQMTLNGQAVTPQVAKAAGVTTVRYDPPQDLSSDTLYSVALTYSDSASGSRTINYDFNTRYVPPVMGEGANIVWVSFHPADDEPSAAAAAAQFTNASDFEYTQLLETAGHTVTRYVTTATPDTELLDTFDLVIISRAVPSGNYQSAESTALWHSLTKPTMHLGGYLLRANRLGFTTGDTIPDASSASIRLKVNAPTHPIFAGISLDAQTNMVNDYAHIVSFAGSPQRGISVNNNPIVSGGTVLATVGTAGDAAFGGTVIAEIPAGTTMGNASADITAGKRLIFLTGSRERDGLTSEGAGIFDLDGDGSRMFLNAVGYMAGIAAPVTVSLTASRTAGGEMTIAWPEAGSEGYALQASPTLGTANWQPVAGTPVVGNGQRTVTVPTTDASRFFRLTKP